jgi:putative glutamine amidotransferase
MTFIAGCSTKKEEPLRIALSSSSENYENWIKRSDSLAVPVDFKGLTVDSAEMLLETCDGLLLTGGEDVNPARYGKTGDSSRCEINSSRDTLEIALIHKAMKMRIPILGVCRGQQILNIAMGGSLIVDIPTDKPSNVVHRCEDYTNCDHVIRIDTTSNLYRITKAAGGIVNTNHHQAVDRMSSAFRPVAWTEDGIIEAIEYGNPKGNSYLQAMQWHPERMDPMNPLSTELMKSFIEASKKYMEAKKEAKK